MKKNPKSKTVNMARQPKQAKQAKQAKPAKPAKPDIAELITKLEQKMVILEMKVDVLIERLTIKPAAFEPKPQPASVPGQHQSVSREPQTRNEIKPPSGNSGGRIMHKSVCADCAKECEVPFVPREGRAVYCKECFSKRRAGSPAPVKINGNTAPAMVKPVQVKPVPAPPAEPERKKWGNVKKKGLEPKKGSGKMKRR